MGSLPLGNSAPFSSLLTTPAGRTVVRQVRLASVSQLGDAVGEGVVVVKSLFDGLQAGVFDDLAGDVLVGPQMRPRLGGVDPQLERRLRV